MTNVDKLLILPILALATILLIVPTTQINAVTFTQKDNEAKEEIFSGLTRQLHNAFGDAKVVILIKHDNSSVVVYNQTESPSNPPPIVNDTQPPVDNQTTPPVDNQTLPPIDNNQTIPPVVDNNTNPQPQSDKPSTDVDTSKTLRVGVVGDIDDNNGLTTQINLLKKYHTQILIVAGDYGYKSCPAVIDKLHKAGWNQDNAVIVEGNHDCSANTKSFNGWSQLYGNTNFSNVDGKMSVFAIDANQKFDCSSTQFKEMKDKLESSDAWYNIVAIHQPFVTVKSDHAANGQFTCWDPLFRANGVNAVLQAHNHNYQRFDVNGLDYLVVGTGTHDSGSSMYPIGSNSWNGFTCAKCLTGINGITLLDLQVDNPNMKSINGWFISNNDEVKDKFN